MSRERLHQAIAVVRSEGRVPLAVLDVDLTIIENAPRTRAILADFARSIEQEWEGSALGVQRAAQMPLVFSIFENLKEIGLSDESHLRAGFAFWRETFFSNEYCVYDVAIPGAVEAVAELRKCGCTVVYLTARVATMLDGTVASFRKLGFPLGVPGTILSMKEDASQADKQYKEQALEWLKDLGRPVVCAENEPAYINLMEALFPTARCVLAATRHSTPAPPLARGVDRVDSLLELFADEQGGPHALDA